MTTKAFHIGDILSVTTAHLVAPEGIGAVYKLLGFMTGDDVFTHQIPRIQEECAPAILAQHPDLADVVVPEFRDEAHVWLWLAEQVERFGMHRELSPMDPADHTRIDPIAELRMKAPHLEIIPVVVDEVEP